MGEGGDVCVWWGKRKKKGRGTCVVWKKKKKGNKKEKEMGSGIYVYGWKKGGVEKKEEKNFEREKTKLVLLASRF